MEDDFHDAVDIVLDEETLWAEVISQSSHPRAAEVARAHKRVVTSFNARKIKALIRAVLDKYQTR